MTPDVDEFLEPFRKGKGFNISGALRNACRQTGVPLTPPKSGFFYVPNPSPLRDVHSATNLHAMWFKPHEHNAGSYVFLVEWHERGGRRHPWEALAVPYATFHDTRKLRATVAWILNCRVKSSLERILDEDLTLCPLDPNLV